jgi:phage tail-like protein
MSQADGTPRLRSAISAELPRVIRDTLRDGSPIAAVVDVMAEALQDRAALIDAAANRFDPATAEAEDLCWLAGWFGWGWIFTDPQDPRRKLPVSQAFPPGLERLRAVLVAWPELHARRGTADGLRSLLCTATGLARIDVRHDPARQHMEVTVDGLSPSHLAWFRRLVAAERPAHMTWCIRAPKGAAA